MTVTLCAGTAFAASATGTRYTRATDSMTKVEDLGWSGSVSVGVLLTSGNVDNANLNVDIKAKLEQERFRQNFLAALLTTESDNVKTAERYLLGYKVDFKLTPHSYVFTDLRVEFDEFSGFDRQTSETIGFGHRFIDTKKNTLDAEIGAGARQLELNNGETESEAVIRGAADYHHLFTETSEFRQNFLILAGEQNTSVDTVTAIKTKVLGKLALEAALKVKHNTEPPADNEKTDTITTLSLVYGF